VSADSEPVPEKRPDPAPPAADAPVPGGARWGEAPGLVARGACMGTADVVPGVSGGTMALILGIYRRLVEAIKSLDRDALARLLRGRLRELADGVHWRFLGPVVCGQALGVAFFTKVVPLPKLLLEHPVALYGLFFGLIVASAVLLARDVASRGWTGSALAAFAAGAALVLVASTQISLQAERDDPWLVFGCGVVAICAMVLPGISGSFVLLLLGQYSLVLGRIGALIEPEEGDVGRWVALRDTVGPFALGAVVGLFTFTRVLSWVLRRAERATLSFMTGLLVGSLWVLWPWQERKYEVVRAKKRFVQATGHHLPTADAESIVAAGLLVAGCAAVLVLDRVARRGRPGGRLIDSAS